MAKNISVSNLPSRKKRADSRKESIFCQCCGDETDVFTEIPFLKKIRVVKKKRAVDSEKIKVCEPCFKREDKFGLL